MTRATAADAIRSLGGGLRRGVGGWRDQHEGREGRQCRGRNRERGGMTVLRLRLLGSSQC